MGLLFFPALEDAIDRWLYVPAEISVECNDESCAWELRMMGQPTHLTPRVEG
jgi:hypothetical protein